MRRRINGFTLIELMIVVTIIGLLAAIAIPVFQKFIRRSKTSEALMNIRKMYDGALTSYQGDVVNKVGLTQRKEFPGTVQATPNENQCCAVAGKFQCEPDHSQWKLQTWQSLQFSVDDPHYYWYEFVSEGEGIEAEFTARAMGNLDCDDVYSTFERIGFVDLDNGLKGGAGLYKNHPIE